MKGTDGRGIFMREILKVAAATLITHRAVQGMIGQNEFQRRIVGLVLHVGTDDRTTIPWATGVLQEVWSLGIFSISTKHIRQLASGANFGW